MDTSIFIWLLVSIALVKGDIQCPFSKTVCNCSGTNDPQATTFSDVKCYSASDIPFSGSEGTYTVTGKMVLDFNAYNLKARSFIAFKSIEKLVLTRSIPVSLPLRWEALAFQGPQIKGIGTTNLAGVIPPPSALLGIASTLQTLEFVNCGETVSLGTNIFEKFISLEYLSIMDTPIKDIDQHAFSGLQNSLTRLRLPNASLSKVPSAALSPLTNLTYLNLTNNGIRSLSNGDFPSGNKLVYLFLGGNPFATIEDDALHYLTEVKFLDLSSSALVSLDLSVFKGMEILHILLLDDSNQLTGLTVSDVNKVPKYADISAQNTVLSTIDSKVDALLANSYVKLDISNNKNINCSQDINWMAKYVLCDPFHLKANNTQCSQASGGTLLSNYLKEKAPNACGEVTTTAWTTTARSGCANDKINMLIFMSMAAITTVIKFFM